MVSGFRQNAPPSKLMSAIAEVLFASRAVANAWLHGEQTTKTLRRAPISHIEPLQLLLKLCIWPAHKKIIACDDFVRQASFVRRVCVTNGFCSWRVRGDLSNHGKRYAKLRHGTCFAHLLPRSGLQSNSKRKGEENRGS